MGIDISVVIPTHNRVNMLKRCLDSLSFQSYPKDRFEIIIIDDGSTDNTKQIVEKYIKSQGHPPLPRLRRAGNVTSKIWRAKSQADINRNTQYAIVRSEAKPPLRGHNTHSNRYTLTAIRYIYKEHKGPAASRNRGAELADGEIIGFVDDDCVLDNEWINKTVMAHRENPETVAVGGNTFSSSLRLTALVSQFLSTCSIETDVRDRKEVIFFPTCNVSFKKSMLGNFRFNEEFPLPGGEDLECFWRLFKSGYRFVWDKSIKVIHYRDDTLMSFIKQAYIYGRGNLLVQYIHKDHPLLKELRTQTFSFWIATLINIVKIPRFSYLLGKRFIKENNIRNVYKKFSVYSYFILHKVFYIFGNIVEYFRINHKNLNKNNNIIIPKLLILDITHRCNLTCRMCDIWKTKEPDIDSSYVKKILLEAKKLGIKEIALSGGEALLRDDIFDILEYARRLKIKDLGILTNGILVAEYIDRLKPYLLDNTISLVLSFDSLTPRIHNYIRNCDFAWEKTKESLNILSKLKANNPNINFNVITIILNQNLEELPDLANFIKSRGANSLQFQPLLPNNLKMAERRKSSFWITLDRLYVLDDIIDKLIDFKIGNSEFIKNSEKNLSLVKKYYRGTISYKDVECNLAKETILMSNEGRFTTCFSAYGDIKKQSLTDVLCSKERREAQEKVKKCKWPCLLPCFCD